MLIVDKKNLCNFKDKSLVSFRLWKAAVQSTQTACPALPCKTKGQALAKRQKWLMHSLILPTVPHPTLGPHLSSPSHCPLMAHHTTPLPGN